MSNSEGELEPTVYFTDRFGALSMFIAGVMLTASFGLACWFTRPYEGDSLNGIFISTGGLTLLAAYLSIEFLFLLKKPKPSIILDQQGLTVQPGLRFFRSSTTLWRDIDSAPQVRRYFKVGHGTPTDTLYLHKKDGEWSGIVDGTAEVSLEDLQLMILKYLDLYGTIDLKTARPVSEPPPDSSRASLGLGCTPATPANYALRFMMDAPPLHPLRAMRLCFPNESEQDLQVLLTRSSLLFGRAGSVYDDISSGKCDSEEAVSALHREFPEFSIQAIQLVLSRYSFYDR